MEARSREGKGNGKKGIEIRYLNAIAMDDASPMSTGHHKYNYI